MSMENMGQWQQQNPGGENTGDLEISQTLFFLISICDFIFNSGADVAFW